jgi:hypothetical protein
MSVHDCFNSLLLKTSTRKNRSLVILQAQKRADALVLTQILYCVNSRHRHSMALYKCSVLSTGNAWLLECLIARMPDFIHLPHLEPEMEMMQVEFFLSGLVCLITGWMEHILGQTRSYSVQNSGRDPRKSHTDTHTYRADRSITQKKNKKKSV